MVEALIDTNILVYAHQPAEKAKHRRAVGLLELLVPAGRACLSAQVLAEFVSATTRGRRPLLTGEEAATQAANLADAMPVLDVTRMIVLEAIRGMRQHRLAFFDAQIWAAARLNQVETIFTEDFQDGQSLEGVRFVNPLVLKFSLDPWYS